MQYSLKRPQRQKQTQEQNKKEWASSVALCQTCVLYINPFVNKEEKKDGWYAVGGKTEGRQWDSSAITDYQLKGRCENEERKKKGGGRDGDLVISLKSRRRICQLVSWCFKSSQPQRIIPELRETFMKRYIVERTNKAEIRPEEQRKRRVLGRIYGMKYS